MFLFQSKLKILVLEKQCQIMSGTQRQTLLRISITLPPLRRKDCPVKIQTSTVTQISNDPMFCYKFEKIPQIQRSFHKVNSHFSPLRCRSPAIHQMSSDCPTCPSHLTLIQLLTCFHFPSSALLYTTCRFPLIPCQIVIVLVSLLSSCLKRKLIFSYVLIYLVIKVQGIFLTKQITFS